MFRTCVFMCALVTGIFMGCSWAPGEEHPPQIYNTNYPPSETTYEMDATVCSIMDSSIEMDGGMDLLSDANDDVYDAEVDVNTVPTNCITECSALQCGTVSNKCGGYITCTPCRENEECVDNFCRAKTPDCLPETDITFCTRFNIQCGSHTGLDNCGKQRKVNSCGACVGIGACVNNVCCQSETDAQFCARYNRECGPFNDPTAADNCGLVRNISCGQCVAPMLCNANFKCEAPVVP